MMKKTDVSYYRSGFANAPGNLDGTLASLVAALDAGLINGYTPVAVATLSESGGLVTATTSVDHGLMPHQVALIEGANEVAFNGRRKVVVVNNTTLQWPAENAETGAATGTITVKVAPIGHWEKSFSDADNAVYRSTHPDATGYYLRISSYSASVAQWQMYENMTSATEGDNPTLNEYVFIGDGRPWFIIGDPRAFYIATSNSRNFNIFGDLDEFDPLDNNACFIGGKRSTTSNEIWANMTWLAFSTDGGYIAKSKNGALINPRGRIAGMTYNNVSSGFPIGHANLLQSEFDSVAVVAGQIPVRESVGSQVQRGFYPGMHLSGTSQGSFPAYDWFIAKNGRAYMGFDFAGGSGNSINRGFVFLDITGPWR